MKIGILSDTHNDEIALKTILADLRNKTISTVIHCGDLSSPSMINFFEGFQVFLSYGNCDYLTGQIHEKIIHLGTDSRSSNVVSTIITGQTIGIIHGNDYQQLDIMKQSGKYRYIFTGHTHQFDDNARQTTRIINPGAANSRGYHRASYAILELESGELFLKHL